MRATRHAIGLLLGASLLAAAPATRPTDYHEDFEHLAGKLPQDFQVLAGEFVVGADVNNHFLELPGDPLDTFGVLFGPADQTLPDVSARIWGSPTGKRFPEFGVGCCDVSGYKLWVLPGQGLIELRKGDDTRISVPYLWHLDGWTHLRLRAVTKGDHAWRVEGKVWADGVAEPEKWTIGFDETQEPAAGRASVWGEPFSGKPIRFDDLTVLAAVRQQ